MREPTRDELKQLMADTFRISAADIPDDANPESVSGWDSLGHIELMLALELQFGVSLPTEMIVNLVSLEAIESFLSASMSPDSGQPTAMSA